MLDLSNCHVPGPDPDFGDIRVAEHSHGWVVFVSSELLDEDIPEWIQPIWHFAVERNCLLINFDREGDLHDPSNLKILAKTEPKFATYNW